MQLFKSVYSIVFILATFLNFSNAQSKVAEPQPIKNLVFEGGGIRGIAYAGALMELQRKNVLDNITRVAGTSAGAIAATLFALGYTPYTSG